MKYAISLLITLNVSASPIQVFYESDPVRAQIVKEIFTVQYQIPDELIVAKKVALCEELRIRGKLDLCLKNNGDLLVVSVDRSFINDSLKIFQAP